MINFNSLCYPTLHEICRLASHDNWCWNLYCGTCGHQEFIKALLLNIHVTPFVNGDNKTLLFLNSKSLHKSFARISIQKLSRECKFPNFLGYLGIGLYYTKYHEIQNNILSKNWIPQLIDLIGKNKQREINYFTNKLIAGDVLSLKDLEIIECCISHSYNQRKKSYF